MVCEECGFAYADHPRSFVVAELASLGPRFAERLGRSREGATAAALLRRRPAPSVWSALEYACHVRDVLLVQRERLFLALVEEVPSFVPMYRDRRAELAGYGDDDPARVARAIEVGAELLASTFARLEADAWDRRCVYNFPEPSERSLEWLAQHTLHEGEHHLLDIDRALAR